VTKVPARARIPAATTTAPTRAAQHHALFIEPTSVVNTGDTVFRVDPPPTGQAVGQVDHGARAFLAKDSLLDVAHQGLLLLRGSWPTP